MDYLFASPALSERLVSWAAPVNVVYENTASSLALNDQPAATSSPVTSFTASSSSP
jgi:hypothetical protein